MTARDKIGELGRFRTTRNRVLGLVGVRPDGSQYEIARNRYSKSELAGACFSPDGNILFVNIQYPGKTIAITGDWKKTGFLL